MFGCKLIRGAFLLGAALLQVAGAPKSAAAKEKDSGVVVLGVWSGKRVDTRLVTEVARRLRELGEDAQPGRSLEKNDWDCAEAECLRPVAERQHALRLLQAAVEEVDRESHNYLITVRLFDRATGRVEQEQANCDGCGGEQRIGYMAATAAKLAEKLDAPAMVAEKQAAPKAVEDPRGEAQLKPPVDEQAAEQEIAVRRRSGDSGPTLTAAAKQDKRPVMAVTMQGATGDSERAAGSRGRTKLTYVATGFAVASGALAITLTVPALLNKPLCSVDWDAGNPGGPPAVNDRTQCLATTLGISWGMTAIATTVAAASSYSKKRK